MENPNKPFGQLNIKSANALLVDPKHSDLEACVWGFHLSMGHVYEDNDWLGLCSPVCLLTTQLVHVGAHHIL